jgi:hypothetical protein
MCSRNEAEVIDVPVFLMRARRIIEPRFSGRMTKVMGMTLPAVVEFATRSPEAYAVVSAGRVKLAAAIEMKDIGITPD